MTFDEWLCANFDEAEIAAHGEHMRSAWSAATLKQKGASRPSLVTIEPIILARAEAAAVLSISVTGLESLVAAGECPAPVQIGKGRVGWLVDELRAYARSLKPSRILPPVNAGLGRPGKPS